MSTRNRKYESGAEKGKRQRLEAAAQSQSRTTRIMRTFGGLDNFRRLAVAAKNYRPIFGGLEWPPKIRLQFFAAKETAENKAIIFGG